MFLSISLLMFVHPREKVSSHHSLSHSKLETITKCVKMKNKKNKSNCVLNIVSTSLGGSVSMGRWLLLGLLLFSQCLLQTHTLPGVVLPVQKLLLVNELGTLSVNQLLSEVFILQELQHVQAVRVSAGNGDQRSHTFSLG